MIPIEVVLVMLWFIIGIGYSKTFRAVSLENDFVLNVFAVFFWPAFLIIASFWNFDD